MHLLPPRALAIALPTTISTAFCARSAMARGDKRKEAPAVAATTAKTAAASASSAAPMKKKTGDWTRSDITVSKVDGYRRDGLLPPADVLPTRIPGDDVTPRPQKDERVCFHDFVVRGLSFPVHDFLRALIRLQDSTA